MRFLTLACSALLLAASGSVLHAADKADDAKTAEKSEDKFTPFPDARSIKQSAVIGGKTVNYTATVGALPVKDDKGKLIGEVVYTAYTVPGAPTSRPVTFAFNGGPGAASVYLNLGAIGPKRIPFGAQGDAPSDPAVLRDNPNSWLDFTDLVFIDPIGTGFSRSREDKDKTKKDFYEADADIHYLSRIIYDWLVANDRLTSPKYLTGESYGGYRVPRLAYYLQTQMGVGISGMTLVSPYLDPPAIGEDDALSPLPWMINLPSMAAGNFERQGKHLDATTMGPVETYMRTQFVQDFLAGPGDKAATDRLSAKVAELTGLDPALVRRMDGRVDITTYLREIRRGQGIIGSVYDSNYTAYDPFPASATPEYSDPLLTTIIAPTTSAMVDFVTRQVGWKVDARYNALSYEVNKEWKRDDTDSPVSDLRKAMATDPKMTVDIVHGWDDLSCPYYGSRLIMAQMPDFARAGRLRLNMYAGGHMFYSRDDSGAAMRRDVKASYTAGS
ncbi:S10 family peptidase [Novosphingobium mangrovi (ex Huang et al. 2023)]|uniref:Peptidase S10 n=1 Tax=Novosphingobium mangrovi (ex Huang et al. 2023) TaxID=2976432 RepID=A0ABT2HZZ2_9SPHN|nr:peptidase S10 [Novosphingobium mangrovi (ex Huang et al. 2023)]MCT2398125.1 peptidase S10 [Novosphingobium mangrovi (ex Huang et al. 2023)]